MHLHYRLGLCAGLLALAACSRTPDAAPPKAGAAPAAPATQQATPPAERAAEQREADHEKPDFIALTDQQIRAAGIEVGDVRTGFTGAVEASATIAADPRHGAVVASTVSGRVIEVRKQLGERVARGEVLAVIESREAAQFGADALIAAKALEQARAAFLREEKLYAEKVSSRQEYELARTAWEEAKARQQLAAQQLAGAGGAQGSGSISLRAPLAGVVTARQAELGSTVDANARLFEVADLGSLSVQLSLSPADAARVKPGAVVEIAADRRSSSATLRHLSQVLDPATRQVQALATLPNASGAWRIGETVRASVALAGSGDGQLAVPRAAVQTVEDKSSVFVRETGGFSVRHVVLGDTAAGFVLVRSGLTGTERIAVGNSYVLKAELGKGEAGEDHD